MEIEELKQELKQIQNNHFEVLNDKDYIVYANTMLEHIGDVDAELRDDLIYIVFDKWIEDDKFTKDQLEIFIQICLDEDHLTYKLGTKDNDSIFTRSFSALIIASILDKQNVKSVLSDTTMKQIKDEFVAYYIAEQDLRGYVEHGGWAHAAAHGADVLAKMSIYPGYTTSDMRDILDALEMKICQGEYVYIDREPERVCVAVRNILERNLLSKEEISNWLAKFQMDATEQAGIEGWYKRINKQNFLKTLYFALKSRNCHIELLDDIESMIAVL